MSKSKCTKQLRFGALLEVEMSKKCTVYTVVARSTFRGQNVKNSTLSDHFWTFRCGSAWQTQGIVHLVKSEQNVRVFPHIFVWGSCFWFCIPPSASSSRRLLCPQLFTHNLLTQNFSTYTYTQLASHNLTSTLTLPTTCHQTNCSHITCHTQLAHTQLARDSTL